MNVYRKSSYIMTHAESLNLLHILANFYKKKASNTISWIKNCIQTAYDKCFPTLSIDLERFFQGQLPSRPSSEFVIIQLEMAFTAFISTFYSARRVVHTSGVTPCNPVRKLKPQIYQNHTHEHFHLKHPPLSISHGYPWLFYKISNISA